MAAIEHEEAVGLEHPQGLASEVANERPIALRIGRIGEDEVNFAIRDTANQLAEVSAFEPDHGSYLFDRSGVEIRPVSGPPLRAGDLSFRPSGRLQILTNSMEN
jgi:hypothetical protein